MVKGKPSTGGRAVKRRVEEGDGEAGKAKAVTKKAAGKKAIAKKAAGKKALGKRAATPDVVAGEQTTAAADVAKKKTQRARTALGRQRILKRLLTKLEDKLSGDEGKATLADYIRLLQLVRDMEAEIPPKEIVVQWVNNPDAPAAAE